MSQTIQDAAVKEIDGHKFEVLKLDPMVSLRMMRRVLAVLGPSIGSMVATGEAKKLLDSKVDIGRALGEFFDRVDDKLLEDLVSTFGAVSFYDGQRVADKVSAIFRGKLPMMLEWIAFCLVSEYGDAWGKAQSAIARAFGAMAQRLESAFPSIFSTSGPS